MTEFKRRDKTPLITADVWENDVFGTLEQYAEFLTNALKANDSNFVLNVNGAWGTGKSLFVNRWAASIKDTHPVVEYNAWDNDSEDDPLTSLLGTCAEALQSYLNDDQELIESIKKKGGRIALRLGGIAAKAGLRKILGDDGAKDICDIFSPETETDLIDLGGTLVEEQIKKQQERQTFTTELKALIEKVGGNQPLPIFIFIDELDRCRPTFAIELLERIKHLFDVDGIKFIISTDTGQLIHSIKAVYGHDFDAATYLQRFFDETFTLPNPNPHQFADLLFQDFDPEQSWMNNWLVKESPAYTFGELSQQLNLTLRQQLQAHHRVMAVVSNTPVPQSSRLHFIHICFLVMLRLKQPKTYEHIMSAQRKHMAWQESSITTEPTAGIFRFVNEYFILMDLDQSGVMDRLNNDHTYSMEARRNRTMDDNILSEIQRSCYNAFGIFTKYPQRIELTETLS
ncbi:P-loop NTPase fold protein [Pontiellaceae bacterium B12219]|nr:P-loop NTPase fold protein [Pontiellaceae bacterium B12219]